MAFDLGNNNNAATGTNAKGKADGYINIYLPTRGGGKKKVGFLSLLDSNEDQKELRAWLEASPDNIGIFGSKVIIEYNSAEKKEEHKFDLG